MARRPGRKINYTLKYIILYLQYIYIYYISIFFLFFLIFFLLSECHEQNPHHHSPVRCHESVSHVLGAEGPHSQRFNHISDF